MPEHPIVPRPFFDDDNEHPTRPERPMPHKNPFDLGED